MSRTVHVLPDADAACVYGAARVADALVAADAAGAIPVLAVSGGSTPSPLYRALAARTDVPWPCVHVVWVDERMVPPDDERSNTRLVREALLDRVPVSPAHVHPVATTAGPPTEVAAAYDALLGALLGRDPSAPGITAAVLGVGDDGHTASLFPGAEPPPADRLAAHTIAPPTSPVADRVTLTPALLDRTGLAVVLVTGAKKAEVVARALDGDAALPASRIRARGEVAWVLDTDAGHRIEAPRR